MAKHVMIFGAGASVCTGAPMIWNFIDSAEDLHGDRRGRADHPTAEFDFVFDLLRNRLRLLYAKSAISLNNFEQVFSLVEMGRLLGTLPNTSPEEIAYASRAIRAVLATTIERRCHLQHSREDGINAPEPYRAVAALAVDPSNSHPMPLPGAVGYLTFNYDLALDIALERAKMPIDYGLGPPGAGVPLLKLHGSLNWSACPKCRTIVPVEIKYLITMARKRLAAMHEQAATRALVLATPFLEKLEQHCEGTEPDPNPAVVPPSWNKTEYHERFGLIWKRAARELSEASEITVIGYSLPAADAFFHDLMTLGLSGPTRIRRFTVVDPAAAVAERFRKLLGPELDGRFHHEAMTFEDYAQTKLGGGVRFRVL